MAFRITTYSQAFKGILCMDIDERLKSFLEKMEKEGHTEKSIAFSVWKKRYKLIAFKNDSRFFNILEDEINKWSWKNGDPRWDEYWKKKSEERRAVEIRKEIDEFREDKYELKMIDKRAAKPIKRPKGYIYFIQGQCGGAIKIGYSKIPEDRLKALQTGYPDTLEILLMIPGDEATETTLHRKFEAFRLRGEWFRPDKYLIDAIKELKAKYFTSELVN